MKFIGFIFFFCVVCGILHAEEGIVLSDEYVQELNRLTNPSNYSVDVYNGKLYIPISFEHKSDGFWYDENGKKIMDPVINFAGKYFISDPGCNGLCEVSRIYDMTSGKELSGLLDMFDNKKPLPRTHDGWEYTSRKQHRADSRLLVVQYWLSKSVPQGSGKYKTIYGCRERSFIMENEKIKPISKTRPYCSNEYKDVWLAE